jgi:UDP-N-acetylglucosamine 2-epimerase
MDLQEYSIEELEQIIAEQQKKILVIYQFLKEENISESEKKRLEDDIVRLKNQMFQYQTVLRKKYSEEFKKSQVGKGNP